MSEQERPPAAGTKMALLVAAALLLVGGGAFMAGKALSGDSAAGKPRQSQKGKQAREAAPADDGSEPAPADDGTVSAGEATEELERIGADAVAYYDANGSYDGLTDSDLSSSLPLRLVEGPCDDNGLDAVANDAAVDGPGLVVVCAEGERLIVALAYEQDDNDFLKVYTAAGNQLEEAIDVRIAPAWMVDPED